MTGVREMRDLPASPNMWWPQRGVHFSVLFVAAAFGGTGVCENKADSMFDVFSGVGAAPRTPNFKVGPA